jgi:hypothetical protein
MQRDKERTAQRLQVEEAQRYGNLCDCESQTEHMTTRPICRSATMRRGDRLIMRVKTTLLVRRVVLLLTPYVPSLELSVRRVPSVKLARIYVQNAGTNSADIRKRKAARLEFKKQPVVQGLLSSPIARYDPIFMNSSNAIMQTAAEGIVAFQ